MDRLRLYKKGQGIWARSLAAVAMAIFLIWGCASLYEYPARKAKIGAAGEVLTRSRLEEMKRRGVEIVDIKGKQGENEAVAVGKVPEGAVLATVAEYDAWWARTALRIPFVEVDVTNGLLVVLVIFLPGAWLVYLMVNRARNADFLIETEAELKKVSWSTKKEVTGASKVVIIFVLVLSMLLWVYDYIYRVAIKAVASIF